jgi:hypothetical protein
MTRHTIAPCISTLLGCVIAATSTAQTQSRDPLLALGWFKDLAGSCWSATYADGKTTDTECYSVQYDQFMRGTIKIVAAPGSEAGNLEGESVYSWNPKMERVDYMLWTSDGNYTSGSFRVEGDSLVFPPANIGAPDATRLMWTFLDNDSFLVTREKRQDGTWKKFFEVTYKRSGAK